MFIQLPDLPTIVAEWAALIPLVVHLSGAHDHHYLIGDACLRGRISLPFFPKLGQLKAVAKLLSSESHFRDSVTSANADSTTVWDVSWGSVFKCANASARELVTSFAALTRSAILDFDTPFTMNQVNVGAKQQEPSTPLCDKAQGPSERHKIYSNQQASTGFRRYQILNVVELTRAEGDNQRQQRHDSIVKYISTLCYIPLLAFATLAGLLGAFGTAAIIVLSCMTKLANYMVRLSRPPGYLDNNEVISQGCMLAAAHENAQSWYLYVGDRAIVDWLLNKPMIELTCLPSKWLVRYYYLAHYLQLLAMTYVAAAKGWDGVFLLCLVFATETTKAAMTLDDAASEWVKRERIKVKTITAKISGRVPMVGAVQIICAAGIDASTNRIVNPWSDGIIAPSTRTKAWKECLVKVASREPWDTVIAGMDSSDASWIKQNTELAREIAESIQSTMSERTISQGKASIV